SPPLLLSTSALTVVFKRVPLEPTLPLPVSVRVSAEICAAPLAEEDKETLAPFALRVGELLNATGPLREISPEPPPVVRLAPTAMFPLPPFTVRVMAPL